MMRDLLTLCRVGLLPVVWSNLWLGWALGGGDGWPWFLWLSVSCLHMVGMAENDFFDRHRDRQLHPERPLPAGRLSAKSVLAVIGLLLAVAVFALLADGFKKALLFPFCAIVAFSLAYNALLKDHLILGELSMGAVRWSVAWLGFWAAGGVHLHAFLLGPALLSALALVVSRYEASHPLAGRAVLMILLLIPVLETFLLLSAGLREAAWIPILCLFMLFCTFRLVPARA